jgi:hypothetical protein
MKIYEMTIGNRRCEIHYVVSTEEMKERMNLNETLLEIYLFPNVGERYFHSQFHKIFNENEADILYAIKDIIESDPYREINFVPEQSYSGSVATASIYVDHINCGYLAA